VICANQVPDHATIARFRVRHQEALGDLFGQVLGLCATGGKEAARRRASRAGESIPRARKERLGLCHRQLVEDWQAGRNFIPAYNAQAVSTEDQIIVAAEITTEGCGLRTARANDLRRRARA
jgi:hypothetical protein